MERPRSIVFGSAIERLNPSGRGEVAPAVAVTKFGRFAVRFLQWMLGLTVACAVTFPAVLCAEDAHIPAAYLATGANSPIAVYTAAVRVDGEGTGGALGESVDNTALAGMSGGTMVIQDTTLTGTVTSDTADHVISGDNSITGSAFAGAAGVPVVIQNSGSNVLIQNATVLNVQFKP